MPLTDQPGRLLAVTIVAPLLIVAGRSLTRSNKYRERIGRGLILFGIGFELYELYWITCQPARRCDR